MATARALVKNAFLSSQKGRLVADEIRGLPVGKALDVLDFSRKKGALLLKKTLNSAIANAEETKGADIDYLVISRLEVNDGQTVKRVRFGARGRVNRIHHRRSHILMEVTESGKEKGK
ncbi:MAG: 50S ribosomal protein L22 [Candidatus Zeuxoniibacter abyssi]|nr:MAG: 50S ribosomal protein L22 [Candidatus Persebacteraceae bacterium AB1(2)]